MQARTDRALIRAAAESRRYLVVDLVAPRAPARGNRMPANLALVLDRSGSMGREKMELAKEAAVAAIRLLQPTDRFAVVMYDTEIDVVVESTFATPEAVRNALRRIAEIQARGGTDLCGGWLRGCEQIAGHLAKDSIGRCLLLTDGQANHGTTDPDEIAQHAAELRRRGVSTSTFGIGTDFNAPLLQRMADEGGGHFYYVETAAQIRDFLTSEIGETLEITARNAHLEIDVKDLVAVQPLTAFRSERDGSTLRVHFGDLVSGQDVQAVLSLTFPKRPSGSVFGVAVSAHADGATLATGPVTTEWTYATHDANDQQPRDREVDGIVAEIYAQRARLEALALNQSGDYARARQVVESTAKRIRGYAGDVVALHRVADELEQEREEFAEQMVASRRMAVFSVGEASLRSRGRDGRSRRT